MAQYSRALRALCRDLAHETDFAAQDVYIVLSKQKGHPLLLGIDVKIRARRVARRLRRASELCSGAAVEAVAFYREFRAQFAPAIEPGRSRRGPRPFDFQDGA